MSFFLFLLIPSFAFSQDESYSTSAPHKADFRQAMELYDKGKLNEAQAFFEKLVEADPSDLVSRRYIRSIISIKRKMTHMDQNVMERDRILDVRRAWIPIKRRPQDKIRETAQPVEGAQPVPIREKVKQIIPEINFTDAKVRDVLRYLSKISDINIVFDEDGGAQAGVSKALASHITIALKDVPLLEALGYILSAKGLKYRLDEYAIYVSSASRLESVELETRYYYLSSGSGSLISKKPKRGRLGGVKTITPGEEEEEVVEEEPEEGEESVSSRAVTIKDVLEQSGVPFGAGSKIFLDKKTGVLLVRNTPSNLAVIEKILGALDVSPYQVAIEAKFVDVVESAARELGLRAYFTEDFALSKVGAVNDLTILKNANNRTFGQYTGSTQGRGGLTKGIDFVMESGSSTNPAGNIFSIANILTAPQFQIVLHALEQSGLANVLSSPKVTTINNQEAKIEVVTEVIYPTEYEITPPTHNAAGTIISPGVALPGGFVTRDTGVILEVTPSVGADRKTISLILRPEYSTLAGWTDYGISAGPSNLGSNAIPVLQPIFTSRNVDTSVIVRDGETVVLGGLIREVTNTLDDKIPFLGDLPGIGRAFRNQGLSSSKRNLLIFVTAYILTTEGETFREPHYAKTKIFNP